MCEARTGAAGKGQIIVAARRVEEILGVRRNKKGCGLHGRCWEGDTLENIPGAKGIGCVKKRGGLIKKYREVGEPRWITRMRSQETVYGTLCSANSASKWLSPNKLAADCRTRD